MTAIPRRRERERRPASGRRARAVAAAAAVAVGLALAQDASADADAGASAEASASADASADANASESANADAGVVTSAVTEAELVEAFLARDAATQRAALAEARRAAAREARAGEPSWSVGALREESTSSATAFSTHALSVGVGLELARVQAAEERRAAAGLAADEQGTRAGLADAVTELRRFVLAAWAAEREAALLRTEGERVDALLDELARLVEAGEQARFDLDSLRAFAATRRLRARVAAARARSEASRLAALTGRQVPVPALGAVDALPGHEDVVALALASHPRLAALRLRVREGLHAVELAGRSHPGRLDLRAGYRVDDAPGLPAGNGYEVEAAYTLPSRALRRRDAAQARAERSARELELARAERRVAAEVEAALAGLRALASIDPAGTADIEAVRDGSVRRYRAGEATLTELLDVLARLEERDLLDLHAEIARREARLELDRAAGLLTAPELARLVEEAIP